MNMIRYIALYVVIMSLLSCVMQTSKPAVDNIKPVAEIIEIDSDVEDDFNEALLLLKSKNYDAAIVLLEKVILKESRVSAPYTNLGMAYNEQGNVKKAEEYFLEALGVELTNPVANNQLGLLYRKQGRFADARKAYTNALTEYPDYLPVVKNLGILCELYMRDLACAVKQYEHYLSLQPDDKTMKIWLADLSQRLR